MFFITLFDYFRGYNKAIWALRADRRRRHLPPFWVRRALWLQAVDGRMCPRRVRSRGGTLPRVSLPAISLAHHGGGVSLFHKRQTEAACILVPNRVSIMVNFHMLTS